MVRKISYLYCGTVVMSWGVQKMFQDTKKVAAPGEKSGVKKKVAKLM